jgi:Uma2 family endonuclease
MERDVDVKAFEPGTVGWSERDLSTPTLSARWDNARYEIVEGVLTTMAPARLDGGLPTGALIEIIRDHFRDTKQRFRFVPEIDIILSPARVVRPDAAWIHPDQLRKQFPGRSRLPRTMGRLRVPPVLILECLSQGHEAHDRETKFRWYAEFGVPNYWLLDPLRGTLECYILNRRKYLLDSKAGRRGTAKPSMFPGLVIKMRDILTY